MTGIALTSAAKGRLWPSFFFLLAVAPVVVVAQQPIYRCGQLYTNVPADPARCQPVTSHAVTVISGTRVQTYGGTPAARSTAAPQMKAEAKVETGGQRQRDDMARAIVVAELDKVRQRHQSLELEYRQAPAEDNGSRRAQLKAAVERSQRDIESLQRELERRPPAFAQP
ncbi:MAG: hypothetical protein ACKOWC_11365 [Limnohabitans sp.]